MMTENLISEKSSVLNSYEKICLEFKTLTDMA